MNEHDIWFFVWAILIIGAIFLIQYLGYREGYKQGQIDQKKGIVKKPYFLIEFKDGERKYLRKGELKQYQKSYTYGYRIIEE